MKQTINNTRTRQGNNLNRYPINRITIIKRFSIWGNEWLSEYRVARLEIARGKIERAYRIESHLNKLFNWLVNGRNGGVK